jgi:hypothetical protein
MYFFILVLAWFLRYDMSLFTAANITCNVWDMSLWKQGSNMIIGGKISFSHKV